MDQDRWNPDSPEYDRARQKISEVVNTNEPRNAHHIVGCGAELGIKAGASPTELRATFESALQHAVQGQPAGSTR